MVGCNALPERVKGELQPYRIYLTVAGNGCALPFLFLTKVKFMLTKNQIYNILRYLNPSAKKGAIHNARE